jgi:hypothetical protein
MIIIGINLIWGGGAFRAGGVIQIAAAAGMKEEAVKRRAPD